MNSNATPERDLVYSFSWARRLWADFRISRARACEIIDFWLEIRHPKCLFERNAIHCIRYSRFDWNLLKKFIKRVHNNTHLIRLWISAIRRGDVNECQRDILYAVDLEFEMAKQSMEAPRRETYKQCELFGGTA